MLVLASAFILILRCGFQLRAYTNMLKSDRVHTVYQRVHCWTTLVPLIKYHPILQRTKKKVIANNIDYD